MTWLIIVLVLIAAFGPVFWLMPSKRDRHLNELRAAARSAGLSVDIKPLLRLNPKAEERVSAGGELREATRLTACYSHHLLRSLKLVSPWQIFANSANLDTTRPAIKVTANWVFDPSANYPPAKGWPESLQENLQTLAKFPPGVLAVVVEPRSVGVYWSEKPSANAAEVAIIADVLKALEVSLLALDQRLLSDESDDNS